MNVKGIYTILLNKNNRFALIEFFMLLIESQITELRKPTSIKYLLDSP